LYNFHNLSIADLQKISVMTHSAVSQTVKQLAKKGIVTTEVGKDARSRIVRLTDTGNDLLEKLIPLWEVIRTVIKTIRKEMNNDLLLGLSEFEEHLKESSFYQRYHQIKNQQPVTEVEIVPFHVKYRNDWFEINREWIEENFTMEEQDHKNLENPEDNILSQGGEIYFTLIEGEAVGAAALKHHGNGVFEVSKMGVRPHVQGLGLGKKLLRKVIERFQARGGGKLFLETNSSLPKAISLYSNMGFQKMTGREDTPYARADVYMEYKD